MTEHSMEALREENERLRAENASLRQELLQHEEEQEEEEGGAAANETAVVAMNEESFLLLPSMEHLPPELLAILLQFSGVDLAIKITICSKTMQETILGNEQYWLHIDFRGIPSRLRLTDIDLSNLLTRVNAGNVTQSLNLSYCRNIRGHGLAPLMHTDILERIDLQETHVAMYEFAPALSVLDSIKSRQLCQVKLWTYRQFPWKERRGTISSNELLKVSFIQSLHKANVQQALEEGSLCNSCKEAVVDKSQQTVPNYLGLPELHCETCLKKFCRRPSCPATLTKCHDCGKSHCQDCVSTKQCQNCVRWYCSPCVPFTTCHDCEHEICYKCIGILHCDSMPKDSVQRLLCHAYNMRWMPRYLLSIMQRR